MIILHPRQTRNYDLKSLLCNRMVLSYACTMREQEIMKLNGPGWSHLKYKCKDEQKSTSVVNNETHLFFNAQER